MYTHQVKKKAKGSAEEDTRPRVFVGSAGESAKVAFAIDRNLETLALVTVWKQAFSLGKYTLNQIMERLNDSDFGIFVFSTDDVALIRKRKYSVTRDNVIFELGLFIGRLGIERNFIVVPRGKDDFAFALRPGRHLIRDVRSRQAG